MNVDVDKSVIQYGVPTEANEDRFLSKEGKMEKSFLNFKVWFALYLCSVQSNHGMFTGC
jgi:hypothetical protein